MCRFPNTLEHCQKGCLRRGVCLKQGESTIRSSRVTFGDTDVSSSCAMATAIARSEVKLMLSPSDNWTEHLCEIQAHHRWRCSAVI